MHITHEEIRETLNGFWPTSSKVTPELCDEYAYQLQDVSKTTTVLKAALFKWRSDADRAKRVPNFAELRRFFPQEDNSAYRKSNRIRQRSFDVITNEGWDKFLELVYERGGIGGGLDPVEVREYYKKAGIYRDAEPYSGFPSDWQEFWRRLHAGDVYGAHVYAGDKFPAGAAGIYRRRASFFKNDPFNAWRYFPVLRKSEQTGKVVNNIFLDKTREIIERRKQSA